MELLIHKSDGSLVPDNPYLCVGKKFIWAGSGEGVVITEECRRRNEKREEGNRDEITYVYGNLAGQLCVFSVFKSKLKEV